MSRRRKDIFSRGTREDFDLAQVVDEHEESADHLADLLAMRAALEEILIQLPKKFSDVIRLVYGFHKSGLALSNDEAGRCLGVSVQRITCLRCLGIVRISTQFGDILRPFDPLRFERKETSER